MLCSEYFKSSQVSNSYGRRARLALRAVSGPSFHQPTKTMGKQSHGSMSPKSSRSTGRSVVFSTRSLPGHVSQFAQKSLAAAGASNCGSRRPRVSAAGAAPTRRGRPVTGSYRSRHSEGRVRLAATTAATGSWRCWRGTRSASATTALFASPQRNGGPLPLRAAAGGCTRHAGGSRRERRIRSSSTSDRRAAAVCSPPRPIDRRVSMRDTHFLRCSSCTVLQTEGKSFVSVSV
jgi:hypothetical protein